MGNLINLGGVRIMGIFSLIWVVRELWEIPLIWGVSELWIIS